MCPRSLRKGRVCSVLRAAAETEAALPRGSAGQRIRCDQRGGLAPLPPQQPQFRRRRTTTPIRRTDGEDEFPLPKQRPVGVEERVARVVDVSGFGSSPIKFDDVKFATSAQIVFSRIANVVTANEETVESLRNGVDAVFQCFRPEVRSILEDAALRVITGFDELDDFANRQNFSAPVA